MKTKAMIFGAAAIASSMLMAADTPEVESVVMSQAQFGRMVTVTYTLKNAPAVVTFDVETNTLADASGEWVSIGGEAVCNAKGAVWRKVTEADADSEGKYTIKWRPDLSWEGHKVSLADGGARAVVTAWALDNTPDYMVVDLAAAAKPNTQRYYPGEKFLPGGLLTNPDYRTSRLVMRKIPAHGVTWTMGSTVLLDIPAADKMSNEAAHLAYLPANYYIGVFEVTQEQWGFVQVNRPNPSYFLASRTMRPVERVCYNEIRNSASVTTANPVYNWPADPNPESFLGLLRTKTGIAFDLPTEAQWEFACRAGHGNGYWGDGTAITSSYEGCDLIGRNNVGNKYATSDQNADPTLGTAIVGSYAPNTWGLYDMHGNVWEFCLDWYEADITAQEGAVNIDASDATKTRSGATGSTRVIRGGAWNVAPKHSRPARRDPFSASERGANSVGFRLCCPAES